MSTRIDGDLPRSLRFEVRLAETDAEIRATQHLRYEVFAGELGAAIDGGEAGLDHDQFDRFCRHLMVCEAESGRIVACTRSEEHTSELQSLMRISSAVFRFNKQNSHHPWKRHSGTQSTIPRLTSYQYCSHHIS